ncbi:MAG: hypothetical protein J6C89_00645 [Clostridia bacterium]|nr:hypothetical protein [Clostridia bacterium]
MKKQVFFNEDPNHFVFVRTRAGKEQITREDIVSFIKQYENTDITDFLICLNASSCWYPSKRTDNVIDKWNRTKDKSSSVSLGAAMMADIYARGLELHKIWIEELRKIGIRPWISIRMNDIHGSSHPGDFLNSALVEEHPEYNRAAHRGAAGYYDFALDYMQEEVREYYAAVAEEALETFDTDGIELDFMREIYSVCIGREHEGVKVINAFLRRIHAAVKRAEKKRGHKIDINVRVPANPELALRLGFDVFAWVDEGLADYITVTPRWASSDNNMPVDIWKKIFGDRVKILAGLEIIIDAYNRRPRVYRYNTLETDTGSACAYHCMGADGIYLFNHMDSITPFEGEDRFSIIERGINDFLCKVGDYNALVSSNRRHVVTFCDVSAVGAGVPKQLPVTLEKSSFPALRVPTGNIPKDASVRLIVGISGSADESTLFAFANAKPCGKAYRTERKYPQYDDMSYFAFDMENDGGLPPVTVCELSVKEGKATVHWAEIEVNN